MPGTQGDHNPGHSGFNGLREMEKVETHEEKSIKSFLYCME